MGKHNLQSGRSAEQQFACWWPLPAALWVWRDLSLRGQCAACLLWLSTLGHCRENESAATALNDGDEVVGWSGSTTTAPAMPLPGPRRGGW